MLILLTNDDGIYAPGIAAAYHELAKLGEVHVVAPESVQSATGHGITISTPLLTQRVVVGEGAAAFEGIAVEGRPADCVKLASAKILPRQPDLIVSGINSGANVGINVLYSGTVAGAIEGAFFGITSVAVSHAMDEPPNYPQAAKIAVGLIRQILDRRPDKGSLWNINVPRARPGWPLGVKTTSLGVKRYAELIERRMDPRGRPYYWSGLD